MPASWELPDPANAQTNAGRPDLVVQQRRALDVRMIHTPDGGEIVIENGTVEMADGLFNAFYLSTFGGNEDDDGTESTKAKQWWGNLGERRPARQLRSRTQAIMRSLPLVPGNLRKVEDAVAADTAWMLDAKVASSISALASIPGHNRLRLDVSIQVGSAVYTESFTEQWAKAA